MTEVQYVTRTSAELLDRIVELRALTLCLGSDMNELLDKIEDGCDELVTAVTAERNGRIIGWTTCDPYRDRLIVAVFVTPRERNVGIGGKLLDRIFELLEERFGDDVVYCVWDNAGVWSGRPVSTVARKTTRASSLR